MNQVRGGSKGEVGGRFFGVGGSGGSFGETKESRFAMSKQSKFAGMTRASEEGDRRSVESIGNGLPEEVRFDSITYDYKSTNQKLLYDFLMLTPSQHKQSSHFNL